MTALAIARLHGATAAEVSGEILFEGRDMRHGERGGRCAACAAPPITMVFQEPMTSLNPLHTIERQVGEILACCTARAGRDAIRQRVVGLLEDVGIPDPTEPSRCLPASALR